MSKSNIAGMFYRINDDGDAVVLHTDGTAVTRIDASVYPVNSKVSARHEHLGGIVLSMGDVEALGIPHEDDYE